MQKTNNYQLNQWEPTDKISREDFNADNAAIDEAIKAAADAAQAANTTAGAAQNTAQTAASMAAQKPYAVGTYTGTGSDMTIEVGFQPSFVIVSGLKNYTDANTDEYACYCVMTGGNTIQGRIEFTDSGFVLKTKASSGYTYPDLNKYGRVYDFIAFR